MLNIPSYDWGNVESPWIGANLSIWGPLLEGRSPVSYPAKTNFYLQGEDFADIFIVADGRVCVNMFHPDGQQKHLYIACPGAMFGEIACILSKPHVTTATAIVATKAYRIPSKECQRQFHSDERVADIMLQYEARKNRLLMAQAAMLAFDRAEQRIAKTLVYLQRAYGQPVEGGVRINLHFTCAELAALVNTSRVTVNNTLLELTRAGTLAKEGSLYIVRDVRALQDLAVQMLDE